jgi:hypothetical protein
VTNQVEYQEKLDFVVFEGGFRVLLPSWLDVADRRIALDACQSATTRLDDEPTPPEVSSAYEAEEKGEGNDRTRDRVKSWEDQRISERRFLNAETSRTQKQLDDMVDIVDQHEKGEFADGEIVTHTYTMAEFSYGDVLWADDEFAEMLDTGEKKIDFDARNRWLLGKSLIAFNGNAYERNGDGTMDPTQLQDTIARALIIRMWARNRMDPRLLVYFRTRGRNARHHEGRAA